eukprot:gene7549-698_t
MASKDASAQVLEMPPEIVEQVLSHPELQNLARTLSYQQRCQHVMPLDKAASEQLTQSVDDLSVTLRCLLSL